MRDDDLQPLDRRTSPRQTSTSTHDSAGGAPGRRSLTGTVSLRDPDALLAVRLRDAESLLAAIECDHLSALERATEARDLRAARTAAMQLRDARDQVDRDLREAETLAAAPEHRQKVERLGASFARLRPRIDRALELAPAPTRGGASVDEICALGLATGFGGAATDDDGAAEWHARLDAPPPATAAASRSNVIDASGQFGRSAEEIAARGTAGPATALPHLDTISRSFGRHDISGIEAHVGGPAAQAADTLGAVAFAHGNKVGFREAPTLHTAAHEAAHVAMRDAGVRLKSATTQREERADQVADVVVSGRSAERLLDGHGGQGVSALPYLEFEPAHLDMGTVALGQTVTAYASLENHEGLDVDVATLGVTSGAAFDVVAVSLTIPAGGEASVPITYAPTQVTLDRGEVFAETSGGHRFIVEVSGVGERVAPRLSFHPSRVDFGTVEISEAPHHERFIITNDGPSPVDFASFSTDSDYPIRLSTPPALPTTLQPGARAEIHVLFNAKRAGTHRNTVHAYTMDGSDFTVEVIGVAAAKDERRDVEPTDGGEDRPEGRDHQRPRRDGDEGVSTIDRRGEPSRVDIDTDVVSSHQNDMRFEGLLRYRFDLIDALLNSYRAALENFATVVDHASKAESVPQSDVVVAFHALTKHVVDNVVANSINALPGASKFGVASLIQSIENAITNETARAEKAAVSNLVKNFVVTTREFIYAGMNDLLERKEPFVATTMKAHAALDGDDLRQAQFELVKHDNGRLIDLLHGAGSIRSRFLQLTSEWMNQTHARGSDRSASVRVRYDKHWNLVDVYLDAPHGDRLAEEMTRKGDVDLNALRVRRIVRWHPLFEEGEKDRGITGLVRFNSVLEVEISPDGEFLEFRSSDTVDALMDIFKEKVVTLTLPTVSELSGRSSK